MGPFASKPNPSLSAAAGGSPQLARSAFKTVCRSLEPRSVERLLERPSRRVRSSDPERPILRSSDALRSCFCFFFFSNFPRRELPEQDAGFPILGGGDGGILPVAKGAWRGVIGLSFFQSTQIERRLFLVAPFATLGKHMFVTLHPLSTPASASAQHCTQACRMVSTRSSKPTQHCTHACQTVSIPAHIHPLVTAHTRLPDGEHSR